MYYLSPREQGDLGSLQLLWKSTREFDPAKASADQRRIHEHCLPQLRGRPRRAIHDLSSAFWIFRSCIINNAAIVTDRTLVANQAKRLELGRLCFTSRGDESWDKWSGRREASTVSMSPKNSWRIFFCKNQVLSYCIQNATYFKKFENVQLYLRAKKKASSSGYPIAPNIPATPRCCL